MASFSESYKNFRLKQKQYAKNRRKKQEAQENKNKTLVQETANEQVQKMKEDRQAGREEGRKYAEELFARQYQGMTPQERQAREATAHRGINRQVQGLERQLLAQQGRSGVRGGAAYAQQADLARMGHEAKQKYAHDLALMDQDLKNKQMLGTFNIEQGEAAQNSLDRRLALDEANLDLERKRQRRLEQLYYNNFSRI